MGDKAIREKYGGKLPKAINRAIRAEVAGGNEALDKLTALAGPAWQSGWKDRVGRNTPEAAAYYKHKQEVVDRMDADVRKRWGLPPSEEGKVTSKPRPAARRGAKRPAARKSSGPKRKPARTAKR